MEHLTTYQILSDKQYGFRLNHSCETQLPNIVEEIQLALDHHLSVDLILLIPVKHLIPFHTNA